MFALRSRASGSKSSSLIGLCTAPWVIGKREWVLEMKTKDKSRKWMWMVLGVVLALQLYAVRELLAAFALFMLGFGAIVAFVLSLYFLHKAWEASVARMLASRHPIFMAARRSVTMIEDLGRRPFRRPGSASVS